MPYLGLHLRLGCRDLCAGRLQLAGPSRQLITHSHQPGLGCSQLLNQLCLLAVCCLNLTLQLGHLQMATSKGHSMGDGNGSPGLVLETHLEFSLCFTCHPSPKNPGSKAPPTFQLQCCCPEIRYD
jgi:hypothetical protein